MRKVPSKLQGIIYTYIIIYNIIIYFFEGKSCRISCKFWCWYILQKLKLVLNEGFVNIE